MVDKEDLETVLETLKVNNANISNEDIIQKKVCSTLSEELDEAINLCDRQDLNRAKEFIENHFGV